MLRERRRHAHYKLNTRLDRKSSRGMIYENEELRLRTININAEVERGQSDIKRLKKENELLRREIWTLRDECDRLSKKVKAKFNERPRCSSCGRGIHRNHKEYHCPCSNALAHSKYECKNNEICNDGACDVRQCSSDESDLCKGNCCYPDGVHINEEIPKEDQDEQNFTTNGTESASVVNTFDNSNSSHQEPHKTKTFDHLSVVSEETLSNVTEQILGFTPDICGSQTTLPSLVRPLTPLTPIDLIANELNDLQATGPPLSYFENILQQHMNNKTENSSDCYSDLKKCSEQTNSWDYNLKSPFGQKYPTQIVPASDATPVSVYNTLESNNATRPILNSGVNNNHNQNPVQHSYDLGQSGEHAAHARTTTATLSIHNSYGNTDNVMPKHFFAPLKPQLKINTTLANQNKKSSSPFIGVDDAQNQNKHKLEPPDIYVTNALATPWHCAKLGAQSVATIQPLPPLVDSSLIKSKNDSVNLDTLLSDIEAISEDILSLQLEGNKSKNVYEIGEKLQQFKQLNGKINNKPYKSEMNLFLMYDDDMSIKGDHLNPLTMATTIVSTGESNSGTSTLRRARSWEGEQQQIDYSPPPNIPDPMLPFPNNRTYIGFNGLKKENIFQVQSTKTPITISSVNTNQNRNDETTNLLPFTTVQYETITKSTPPILQNTKFKTEIRSDSVQSVAAPNGTGGGDKSLLNNASLKRALFRSAPTQRIQLNNKQTEVYDNLMAMGDIDIANVSFDRGDVINAIKEKEYGMSILCDDMDNSLPEYPSVTDALNDRTTPKATATAAVIAPATTTGSCCDLPTVLPNQTLRHIKKISHSTPNSPHSTRRHDEPSRAECNVMAITPSATSVVANSKQIANATDVSESALKHQQNYPNATTAQTTQGTCKSNKQDTMLAAANDMICAAANVIHTKCVRRHSDGTIIRSPSNQRFTGSVSNGIALTHTQPSHSHSHSHTRLHHHPHPHPHQYQNQKLPNYRSHHQPNDESSMSQFGHQSNQRLDNNHETVALSYAGRSNSNGSNLSSKSSSLSSSSSSTSSHSYSQHSQRRKVSINSHTGGKIPWCGCWGTGCL